MQGAILMPAAVLVLWSLVMMFWMAGSRLPALSKLGGLGNAKPGGRGQDLEGVLPDHINWKAHNYAHLMEQPTLFYATVMILAILGATPVDVGLAWGYAGIRVIHSVWQSTVNRVPVRFTLFLLSSMCLIALAIRALVATFGQS
ncbi:MAPEG family protein [Novosphingobium sp.]|uniref:MAPEG family protein n=1 Tax=Novosphingobium sp. TaxID=1874826 RepID=UPI00356213C3